MGSIHKADSKLSADAGSWSFLRGLSALAILVAGLLSNAEARQPQIQLTQGTVQGFAHDGVVEFRHLPYAEAPVGELRWRPPSPPKPWAGILDGTRFAPGCPAIDTLGVFGAPSESEDCLYLNVTAPSNAAKRRMPVMLWIPGGAFFNGSAADYDASALARRGVVVVTINYRVGILGFFAHPMIDGEGHPFGNYGLMDQQAALRWVRDNIARFGGDAANVTISGESAGGISAIYQLVSPAAQGLFHKAINQSGSRMVVTTIEAARATGTRFAAAVGCAQGEAACLRALPVKALLEKQRGFLSGVMVDGVVLPSQPGAAILAGSAARVPLLTGFTAREQAFALAAREMTQGPLRPEGYASDAAAIAGAEHRDKILVAYPISKYGSPVEADIAAIQGSKACISRWLASAHSRWAPTYAYEFDDATAPSYFPPISFEMGAYHTADIQYLFPLFRGGLGTAHPLNNKQQKVSREMIAFWTNFAKTGSPNGANLRKWNSYDPKVDAMIALGSGTTIIGYGWKNNCEFWDRVNPY